jgi:hypothetical protein
VLIGPKSVAQLEILLGSMRLVHQWQDRSSYA